MDKFTPPPAIHFWSAGYRLSPLTDLKTSTPSSVDDSWLPLRQNWLSGENLPTIEPGWAKIEWTEMDLVYTAIFMTSKPTNRARTLNERVWEMGDACEIFLQLGRANYLELQVTPENQRLQLLWPVGGRARVIANRASLTDFEISDTKEITTESQVAKNHWSIRVRVPFSLLSAGSKLSAAKREWHTAVCRYDYGTDGEPTISSTAALTNPDFHRLEEWHELALGAMPGGRAPT